MARAGIILAAGKGTRMGSSKPKVMQNIAGIPMLGHVIRAMAEARLDPILVVTAPEADDVRAVAVKQNTQPVIADRLLGPGYSAWCASRHLADFDGDVVVAYGDQPLVTARLFEASFAGARTSKMSSVVFAPQRGATYGRVVLDADAYIDRIVEYADATPAERAITLCSAGMFTMAAKDLLHWTSFLTNQNRRSEYYLAELPLIARRDHARCLAVYACEKEVMGVNTPAELARAEALMRAQEPVLPDARGAVRQNLV